jgi:hypothetical protein
MIPLATILVLITLPTIGYMLISLFEGFPRLRIIQIVGIVAVTAWIFTPFALPVWDEGPFLFFSGLILLLIFLVFWRREFRLLMLRRDDEFPGRFDKLGWFLILSLAAPAGIWLYRSFRKVRWPEAGTTRSEGLARKPAQNPWDHEEEDKLSPSVAGVE